MCQWYMSKGEAPLISALGTNRFVGQCLLWRRRAVLTASAINRNLLAANMWLCGKKPVIPLEGRPKLRPQGTHHPAGRDCL